MVTSALLKCSLTAIVTSTHWHRYVWSRYYSNLNCVTLTAVSKFMRLFIFWLLFAEFINYIYFIKYRPIYSINLLDRKKTKWRNVCFNSSSIWTTFLIKNQLSLTVQYLIFLFNNFVQNGFTPLHIACKKNHLKVVELLLRHGAPIEAPTEVKYFELFIGVVLSRLPLRLVIFMYSQE